MSRARRDQKPRRRTVVFDFGSVLSAGSDPTDVLHELLGGDLETLRAAIWEHRPGFDDGSLSPHEYWSRVAAAVGVEELTEEESDELTEADIRYFLRLDPDSRALLHDLARERTTLVLLSNASARFGEAVRRAEWFEVFSFAVISAEERIAKPDPEIYRIVLETIAHQTGGVSRPGDVVFFDDKEENVAAAKSEGIDAHHWPRNDDSRPEETPNSSVIAARRVLADRGVLAD